MVPVDGSRAEADQPPDLRPLLLGRVREEVEVETGCGSAGEALRSRPSAGPEPSGWTSVRQVSLLRSSAATRFNAAVQKATARGRSVTPMTGIPSLSMSASLGAVPS